ncbi:LPXTG cell wall anchor domain-containing protein, partial [Brochothrix thermosphacta]|uniref:LPXTG cell wall anchor domain-containing protein n=1 Tax=Brochothrix thermosphacta TaxID=2756 RepID=UPI000ED19349
TEPSTEPSTKPSTEPSTDSNIAVSTESSAIPGTVDNVAKVEKTALPHTGEESRTPITFVIGLVLIVFAFRQLTIANSESKR